MRVLLVTDWMRLRGGVETYVPMLRDGLRAEGDQVRLLTSSAGAASEASPDYVAYGTERAGAQAVLQVVNPSAVAELRRALREFRPELVHVQTFAMHLSPAIFAPLRSVPTVLSVNDYKPVCPTSWKLLPDGDRCAMPAGVVCWRSGCTSLPHWLRDRPRYRLIARGVRNVDRVLAPSRSVKRELALGGIDSELLTLPVVPPERGFVRSPAPDPIFVFAGRLSREKGVSLLLRAFARLRAGVRGATLRLVGDGPARSELQQLTRRLGIDQAVSFRGRVPADQMERELVDAWSLVAPSLHAEPLGLVAIEAMVRGVPVIASADGGFAETVTDGLTGLLFPNGDEAALTRSMASVAERRAFSTQRLPDQLVRRVREAHCPVRHVRRLRRTYKELLAR